MIGPALATGLALAALELERRAHRARWLVVFAIQAMSRPP